MAKRLLGLAAVAVACWATPALSCMIILDHEPTARERQAEARRVVEAATVIVDGEVVEADAPGDHPARIRAFRHFKGEVRDYYLVSGLDSCDISLRTVGERWRLVLSGGPDVFHTSVDYSNASEIDALLGSDRRKDWPMVDKR